MYIDILLFHANHAVVVSYLTFLAMFINFCRDNIKPSEASFNVIAKALLRPITKLLKYYGNRKGKAGRMKKAASTNKANVRDFTSMHKFICIMK